MRLDCETASQPNSTIIRSWDWNNVPRRFSQLIRAALLVLLMIVAARSARGADTGALSIGSPAFLSGATIAPQFSCVAADQSPPLAWTGVPDGTKSLALIVADPDAPSGTFIHWVIFNLPPATRALPDGVAKTQSLAQGGVQGINSFRQIGYNGPCPPRGPAHHYHFKLYALDSTLDLNPGAHADAVEAAASGHVLATAELVGIFGR